MSTRKPVNNQKELEEQKQHRKNCKALVEKVQNHWPDIPINEKNLIAPTSQFVYKFYEAFYAKYEMKLNEIRTQILNLEPEPIICYPYSEEINLAITLRRICQNLDIFPIRLNDLCEPSPKRTFLMFSVLVNLLAFFTSGTDYIDEIIEVSNIQKQRLIEYEAKQKALVDIEACYVEIDYLNGGITKHKIDIENLSIKYQHTLQQKKEKDLEYQRMLQLINEFEANIATKDKELLMLEEEDTYLNTQIVKENEIDELNDKIQTFTKKLESLEDDCSSVECGLKERSEEVEESKKCLEQIATLDLSEDLNNAVVYGEKTTMVCEILKSVDSTNLEIANLKKKDDLLQESYRKTCLLLKNIKSTSEQDESNFDKLLTEVTEKINQDNIICDKNKYEINEIQESTDYMRGEIETLKSGVLKRYKSCLQYQSKVNNKFNEALINIAKHQEELGKKEVDLE